MVKVFYHVQTAQISTSLFCPSVFTWYDISAWIIRLFHIFADNLIIYWMYTCCYNRGLAHTRPLPFSPATSLTKGYNPGLNPHPQHVTVLPWPINLWLHYALPLLQYACPPCSCIWLTHMTHICLDSWQLVLTCYNSPWLIPMLTYPDLPRVYKDWHT